MARKVSLYIPCLNGGRYLDETLRAVFKQTYPIEEVIVIDGGSRDGSRETASSYPVRLLKQEDYGKKGLAIARNIAIKEARGEFIASVNVDCAPEPTWLERLMSNFDDNKVAGVSGDCREWYTNTLADKWRAVHMYQGYGSKKLYNPPILFGTNHVFRRSALLSVGLYYECHTFGEDINISSKLKRAGYKTIYDPEGIVWHLAMDDIVSVLSRYCGYFYCSHPRPITLPWTLLSIYRGIRQSCALMLQDLKWRNYSLIPIDFLLFFVWAIKTTQAYFSEDRAENCVGIFLKAHRNNE